MYTFLKYEEINFQDPVISPAYEYAMKEWPYAVDETVDQLNSQKRLIYINGVIVGVKSQTKS